MYFLYFWFYLSARFSLSVLLFIVISITVKASIINHPGLIKNFMSQLKMERLHQNSDLNFSKSSYRVADHMIPDKCANKRKNSYKSCLSAVVLSSACFGGCAATNAAYPICVAICAPGTIAAIATCSTYIGEYDSCCNNLKDDVDDGWTKQDLWDAALCDSCMSKNDVIKDICNK